jgi:hypothetical protein
MMNMSRNAVWLSVAGIGIVALAFFVTLVISPSGERKEKVAEKPTYQKEEPAKEPSLTFNGKYGKYTCSGGKCQLAREEPKEKPEEKPKEEPKPAPPPPKPTPPQPTPTKDDHFKKLRSAVQWAINDALRTNGYAPLNCQGDSSGIVCTSGAGIGFFADFYRRIEMEWDTLFPKPHVALGAFRSAWSAVIKKDTDWVAKAFEGCLWEDGVKSYYATLPDMPLLINATMECQYYRRGLIKLIFEAEPRATSTPRAQDAPTLGKPSQQGAPTFGKPSQEDVQAFLLGSLLLLIAFAVAVVVLWIFGK